MALSTHPSAGGCDPRAASIHDLLRLRVEEQPDRVAYRFIQDDGTEESITYGALYSAAHALATTLESRELCSERVLVLCSHGLEFAVSFFGCLLAGCIAVPAGAPRARRSNVRLESIIADCQPKLALCGGDMLRLVSDSNAFSPTLRSIAWMDSQSLVDPAEFGPRSDRTADANPGQPAFLQYTSGSTGVPKGVMVSHANLLANSAAISQAFRRQPDEVGVSWLPLYHDMGLIGGLIQPLSVGCPCMLMSPISFVAQPIRWLEAISRYRATVSGGPNFAYDLCTRKITDQQAEKLDLTSWRVAFNGADPIRADVLDRFAAKFAPHGFRREALHPCYGLAESTLLVTGGVSPPTVLAADAKQLEQNVFAGCAPESPSARRLIGCGKPAADHSVVIADPETSEPCPAGRVGEIWVAGPSAAQGYWNRPEETGQVFQARLSDRPGEDFVRTGDLGFLHEEELFVTGRLKDLIIIRGTNYYPQDLEQTVERSHPALNPHGAAAFSIETPEGEAVAIVAECARPAQGSYDAMIGAMRAAIAEEHDLSVKSIVLVRPGGVPRTSSGKIQRRACREAFLAGGLAGVIAQNDLSNGTPATGNTSHGETNGKSPHNGAPSVNGEPSLMEQLAQRARKAGPRSIAKPRSRDAEKPADPREPLAIIGMGCRFPGAENLETFRSLLMDGRDGICEIPADRWDAASFFDADPDAPGKMVTRWGGFLPDVDLFDAQLFGISPREANRMDPQQRLLLEVSWRALEHAGLPPDRVAGSHTGVFVGIGGTDYSTLQLGFENYLQGIDAYSGTGNAHSIAANRISYLFDLRGPSLAIDTACSSSLVAMHLACQALRNGDCEMALVAGVNVILSPEVTLAFSKARMLSADGRCFAFDDRANGYVRAEGCGVLVVKRLRDAQADGDRILAVVRGTAVNQDGRTSGITAPSGDAQQAVIRSALEDGGISPDQLSYIEAHGTATPLGDPIEVDALRTVIGDRLANSKPCFFGSVKANIGHLETASGVAGVIKVVLMLQQREIYRQINFKKLNRHIALGTSPLRIPTQIRPWPVIDGRRIAGVNSFGFGGTNAHVVLEESSSPPSPPAINAVDRPRHLLTLSAHNKSQLKAVAELYGQILARDPQLSVADFCHSANINTFQHAHRAAISAESAYELCEQLQSLAADETPSEIVTGSVKPHDRQQVAFLFTGQGSQYAGMGRELYETQPTFRRVIDTCHDLLKPYLPEPLLSVLYPAPGQSSPINQTLYAQPAIFAVECALGRLWESWGVRPAAVMGHSIGEFAAAHLAGVFSLEDGVMLVAERARLMQSAPAGGSMAVVLADEATVAEALASPEFNESISIAAVNGPKLVVVSGEAAAVSLLLERFGTKGIAYQQLNVSHAFHSFMMDGILDEFEQAASRVNYRTPQIPLISNLDGRVVLEENRFDASYWRRHLRQAVRFQAGMETLAELGCGILLEIGPDSQLISMGKKCLKGNAVSWAASLRKGKSDWQELLRSAGELFVHGAGIDWRGFDKDYARTRVAIPLYPMLRERFWSLPQTAETGGAHRGLGRRTGHPLLGTRVRTANQTQFEAEIGLLNPSYLKDHCVHGSSLVPAAAYLEMAISAAKHVWKTDTASVEDVTFQQALFLDASANAVLQLIISPEVAGRSAFQIYSQPSASPSDAWTLHVSGTLVNAGTENSLVCSDTLDELRQSFTEELPRDELYQRLAARGLQYGPNFQGVERIWRRADEGLACLQPPAGIQPQLGKYQLHPVLLDSAFHVLAAAISESESLAGGSDAFIPIGVESLTVAAVPYSQLWVHARIMSPPAGSEDLLTGDVFLMDATGQLVAKVSGLRLKRLGRSAAEAQQKSWNELVYEIRWKSLPTQSPSEGPLPAELEGTWVVFADRGGVGDEFAAQLSAKGIECTLVRPGDVSQVESPAVICCDPEQPESVWTLLEQLHGDGPRAWRIVYLWPLDAAPTDERPLTSADLECSQSLSCLCPASIAQHLARQIGGFHPHFWMVSRGAQLVNHESASVSIAQAPLWGLGRAISRELPEIEMGLIDLDPRAVTAAAAASLLTELCLLDSDRQIAIRGTERWAPRLEHAAGELLEEAAASAQVGTATSLVRGSRPFRVEVGRAGTFDSLPLRATQRLQPAAGQVEIEVHTAGLNFSDVLKALGLYPGIKDTVVPLGIECSGRITAVGEAVEGWTIGDEVIALAPYTFGKYAITPAYGIMRKPDHISFEAAAGLSVAFITALYALEHLGRLRRGERVLIHAGAGGVGQAAIQIAKAAGAEIFATAGTPEKREFLKSMGVDHVLDSRTLGFYEEILKLTGGEGVDLVLNSLAGEAIPKSFSLLRAYGRFLEIGKIDIYQNRMLGLQPFQDNLSFFAIDMDRLFRQRPDLIALLMATLSERFANKTYSPLPFVQFPITDVGSAFRYMAQRKNIGKVVVALHRDAIAPVESDRVEIDPERSYLITGGLGGLGLELARWLADRGARHLCLLGRRAPSPETEAVLADLRSAGIAVHVLHADVARREQLDAALDQIRKNLPPLGGVVHAAGVLDDGLLNDLTRERFETVLAPKIAGAWNLHSATLDDKLDFFILFSSIASVLGAQGQANYAAANAFLDALAQERHQSGRCALSVNWGPWENAGMTHDAARRKSLERRGLKLLSSDQALELLDDLIALKLPQATVLDIDWAQALRLDAGGPPPLVRDLVAGEDSRSSFVAADSPLPKIQAAPPEERLPLLVAYFIETLAKVSGQEPGRIDAGEPLSRLGLDSLMAMELKNAVESALHVSIPMATLFQDPSPVQLAELVLAQWEAKQAVSAPAAESATAVESTRAETASLAEPVLESAN